MINNQPVEKLIRSENASLDFHSIFHTIQGEGPFSGWPAMFIRLAGCNLQCPACDTEYTHGRQDIHDIGQFLDGEVEKAVRTSSGKLAVITGGEPFRQPAALANLLRYLNSVGFVVQIETNGTLPPPLAPDLKYHTYLGPPFSGIYIVCSPKTGRVHPDVTARACCYKYVLSADELLAEDQLPTKALGHTANPHVARPPAWWDRPIYVQPQDDKDPDINRRHLRATVEAALRHGYITQIQLHKLLELD